ncbi:multicopper oxidase family protein [Catellatospora tritici]|uniref:multicopper oxidase family protein n=1 Tax=Catellatospora tritici TaxID=2851566 RepID=UPI001C2D415C|nr:multicopper oxidase family protein [Catellatospora tritici]MBV1853869.1 multicopper oxidase family protein [Catellatospora tritici]
MSGGVTRRRVLGAIGVTGAATAVGVPWLSGIGGASSTGVQLRSETTLPEPYTQALRRPTQLAPTRSDATTDYYEVTQRVARVRILPGLDTTVWAYQGSFPGPTIRSRRGRTTVVRHRNELPVPTVVHLHGGRTPAQHDGYPVDLIMPADGSLPHPHGDHVGDVRHGERDYIYPMDQRAATLWYHDHRMDFTGPAVWRGLAGFHLHTDEEEQRLPLPTGDRDLPLLLADRAFTADGSLAYPSLDPTLLTTPGVRGDHVAGVLGDVVLVNGVPWPQAEVPGARHRLRLLNGANARRFRVALHPAPPGGGGLVQIGTDQGLLAAPVPHDAIELAPGQRFDVVVDFARYPAGTLVELVNEFGDGRTEQVMRFKVGERVDDPTSIPEVLSEVAPLRAADAVVTRTMRFGAGNVVNSVGDHVSGWKINGLGFSPDAVHAAPKLGTVEVWQLVSDLHHPVHLHLAPFQVLRRGNGGPGPYDLGWKDTVDLRPAELVEIAARFDGYPGRYVFHCHNLEHEDMAMMGNMVVS